MALDGGGFLKRASLEALWWQQPLGQGGVNSFGAGWAVRDINGHRTGGHWGRPALSDLAAGLDDLVLVLDEPQDGGTHRQYRARPGTKAVTWDFQPGLR